MKKKVLLSAVLTIALCLSLIAGSTFALFTSTDTVNVAVTAGKVNVVATATEPEIEWDSRLNAEMNAQMETNVSVDGNVVNLDKIVPGVTVKFNINVENNSDVTILYRTVIKLVEDEGLWEGLNVTINETPYEGNTIKTAWTTMTPTQDFAAVSVKIEFPYAAGNEYQAKSCSFAYTVEAVQGNAEMPSEWDGETTEVISKDDEDVYHIETAAQFVEYLNSIHTNDGKQYYNVVLDRDIDLGGYTYKVSGVSSGFSGSFDGQNHIVSNYVIERVDEDNVQYHYTGLFSIQSWAQDGRVTTIKNLTVKNGTVIGKNSKQVAAIVPNLEANGALVENCHAIDCTVIGLKKVGVIAAYVCEGSTVKDCSATNCNVYAAEKNNKTGADKQEATIYGYNNVGTFTNNADPVNCVAESGVTTAVVSTASELATALDTHGNAGNQPNRAIVLTADLDMSSWQAINGGSNYPGIAIYGNGHTLKNQSAPLFATLAPRTYVFKDINFTNVNIADYDAAVIVAVANSDGGASYTISNCHIDGGTLTATRYAAGFIGHAANFSGTTEINITGCSVKNVELTGNDATGGLVGCTYAKVVINDCTVTGCAITSGANGYSAAALVGTAIGTSNVTASNVNVSGNTYANNGTVGINNSTYGYIYVGTGLSYTVNGANVNND